MKTMKRAVSMLLALIMVLSIIPGGVFAQPQVLAAEAEAQTIDLDFSGFAKWAARQSWWAEMKATDSANARLIGSKTNTDAMTDRQKEIYDEIQSYLQENESWRINETETQLTNNNYCKRLYIDASGSVATGLRFYPYLFASQVSDNRAKLVLTVVAQAEGLYNMELDLLKEAGGYSTLPRLDGMGQGGGYGNVYVNDTMVYENYFFGEKEKSGAKNRQAVESLGAVYLNEGENDIVIEMTNSYTGSLSNGRRVINLLGMTFRPIAQCIVKVGGGMSLDVYDYLPFDVEFSPETNTVISMEPQIAGVTMTDSGRLIVDGVSAGETQIHILDDEGLVYALDVTVVEAEAGEQAQPVLVDFKAFAKRAATQSWWQELTAVNTAGGSPLRKIGSDQGVEMTAQELAAYEQMLHWMQENQNWSLNGEDAKITEAAGNRLYLSAEDTVAWGICHNGRVGTVDGSSDLSVDVRVENSGWYALNMELVLQNDASKDYPLDSRTNPGGGYADIYVNGERISAGVKFRGTASDVVEYHFGKVFLNEGTNNIAVRTVGEYNNPIITSYSGRTNIGVAAMELLPVMSIAVEKGMYETVSLSSACLLYDQNYSEQLTVQTADDTVAAARINDYQELVVTGLSEGSTRLTVFHGEDVLWTAQVYVSAPDSTVFDFTKGAALTAEGFAAVETYEDLPNDGIESAPWHYEAASGKNYYDTQTETAALLGGNGAYVSFAVQTQEGQFQPVLRYYANAQGGKIAVYVDDLYLGTVDTYAPVRKAETAYLRPVELTQGEHILKFEITGAHVNLKGAASFNWSAFVLKQESDRTLALDAGTLTAKPGRMMQTALLGVWSDGRLDDLYQADLQLQVSHEDILQAQIIPATLTEPARLQVMAAEPVEDAYVTVLAQIGDVAAQKDIPVTVLEASPVVSADVALEGTETGLIPRLSTRAFVFDLLCADGDHATPEEVRISYEISDPAIISVNEEDHTLFALADGEASVTVTVEQGTFTYTKTMELTVADAGENRMNAAISSFDDASAWTGMVTPGDDKWIMSEITDDGTGNQALKLTVNPNISRNQGNGIAILSKNGTLAPLQRGQLYEMSFRFKVEGYERAPSASMDPRLILQFYDYATNAYSAVTIGEYYSNYVLNYPELEDGVWYDLKIPVRAPIAGDGICYGLTRLTFAPHYAYPGDMNAAGFAGSFWFDDIEIREVGFETVENTLASDLSTAVGAVAMYARPMTTTGEQIKMDAGSVKGNISVRSSDEDVVRVEDKISALSESRTTTEGAYEYASVNVRKVGKNDAAQLITTLTIGTETREGTLHVSVSGQPDVLRDVTLMLNGCESLVLKRGETAQGTITGLTTQLNEIAQEAFEGLYFTSSDLSVATVDAYTGEVTCVGEGTAVITGYAMYDGKAVKDTALITVTDDTDLAAIEITAPVDFVGTGSTLRLSVTGTKASGSVADMTKYPVAWSMDEESILGGVASITEDGLLTGLKVGTVTVTATVGVEASVISDSMLITVFPAEEYPGGLIDFDFTDGGIVKMDTATLEKDNIEINRELTYGGGEDIEINQSGFILDVPVGGKLALDFVVRKAGWYRTEVRGRSLYYWGCLTGCYVDQTYIGTADFGSDTTSTFAAGGYMNTIYLEAGVHTLILEAEEARKIMLGRVTFYPTTDPNEVDISLKAGKTSLVAGESTTLELDMWGTNDYEYFLHYSAQKPAYTNYYSLESSDTGVVKITRDLFTTTLTAVKPGTAAITMTGELLGKAVTKQMTITVKDGTISSAKLTAERTTVAPDAEAFALMLTLSDKSGELPTLPENVSVSYESGHTEIANVSSDGVVTITGTEGSALITATVTEGENVITAQIWITVTSGKTEPSLYTNEERAIARENVLKYDWAWQQKESVVSVADYYVEHLEQIYNMWPHEGLPRNTRTAMSYDTEYMICRYCGTNLIDEGYGGYYHWLVDPIENPWKVTCPACKKDFPSNDFGSFYACGLDEQGKFTLERAMANGGEQYLVNELYPEMGEGWGVDNGWGYNTGEKCANGKDRILTFIAYYVDCTMYTVTAKNGKHSMPVIFNTLRDAYIYTGDEKYGSAGAILVDRMADIYPDYDLTIHRKGDYSLGDGSSKKGKIAGSIWECVVIQAISSAVDAFWPSAENADVIEFLQKYAHQKGVAPEEITPDYLRRKAENNILLEAKDAIERNQANGNFGMEQAAMAISAVALDRMPETKEMIDWVFAASMEGGMYENAWNTGGDVYRVLAELVDRDGFGNEGSISYNGLWLNNLKDLADALNGYDKVESANLWEHPKFLNLYRSYIDLTICGRLSPQIHETSGAFQYIPSYINIDRLMEGFLATGDEKLAQTIYAGNGNSVAGLHGDIFTKDPEHGVRSRIQEIVDTKGEWNMSESGMLPGFGIAILREGPAKYVKGVNDHEFFDVWINFSLTNSHTHHEALHMELEAFGLTMSGNMGYPVVMSGSSPERNQWNGNTVSNNTVVVDDSCQYSNPNAGFPLHFEDGGKAKVMDVSSPDSYDITDIYRRTVVTVEGENGVDYVVDFFRILGGSEHVYSYHGATRIQPTTEGLDLIKQPFGTYAGADIPFGDWDITGTGNGAVNTGSGYSWLYNVSRDNTPDTTFSVDWQIEDYQHQLTTSDGIHMRLTMLSEEPLTEVALADGQPAQDGRSPDHVEFLLARNSGAPGLDTLFTAVIEPYQVTSNIVSTELVDVVLVEGTENATDRAAAVKTVQSGGRVDYIIYATNPNCTYEVDGKLRFRGFAGVCSYKNDTLTYAWGNEVTTVEDANTGAVIENAQSAVTGTVESFTDDFADKYTMTIRMDEPVSKEELINRYIYVDNDGIENAVYRIYNAEVTGNMAVLDLDMQDLIRGYIDAFDMERGYIYNIAAGQTYSIPLSATFDADALFAHVAHAVVKTGNKMSLTTGAAGSGVTYKADGLPNGAKFSAADGTLVWTPTSAQAGRYPITVYAMDGSTVLAEMSFVIYAVSYTGSTYPAASCAHAKAVTYTVDGIIETVCPACGTITKRDANATQKFDLAGANMTLGNELKLNFLVKTSDLPDGEYTAKITHNGEVTEAVFARYNSGYQFVSYAVSAKQMADTISVVVCDEDGNEVSNVYETSVRTYAMNLLGNKAMTAKIKTLLVDMLNYGSEAQNYFSYNKADLANALLTDAQKALATAAVTCTNKQVKGQNFYGANLSLEDRILLNIFFKNVTEGMTAKVTYRDYAGTAKNITKELVQHSGNIYKVILDEIVLADAFSPVTVTVYKADGTIHGSGTDSVESYIARTGNSALNDAIMKFAYSAKAYLG